MRRLVALLACRPIARGVRSYVIAYCDNVTITFPRELIAKGFARCIISGRGGCKMMAVLLRVSRGHESDGGGVNFLGEG